MEEEKELLSIKCDIGLSLYNCGLGGAHYDSSPIYSCQFRVDLKEQASTFSTGLFLCWSHSLTSVYINKDLKFSQAPSP